MDFDMPATVRKIVPPFAYLQRPTGLTWRVHFRRLRPATTWQKRQLVAVGRLHQQRRKGLGLYGGNMSAVEKIVAGTVGEDVMTIHKLAVIDEYTRRAVCGAQHPSGVTDIWRRAVNCRECLAIESDSRP
ncbi:hypothetical protein [Streptomyces niveus]|uniref:hypothetical protein n=1 Tax=Streptomyces niveus TaxID=193462 RepID=UPI003693D65C